MKAFFHKYMEELDEEIAIKMIHCKIHEIMEEYDESEDYTKELKEIKEMICDLLETKAHSH